MTATEFNKATTAISNAKMLKIIASCMQNMYAWKLKIPGNISWREAMMDDVGETIWLRNDITGNSTISIVLNKGLVTQSDQVIRDTIYHELAHAATGEGHSEKWKAMVAKIRTKTGLPLSQVATPEEMTKDYWLSGYKYVVCCRKCGQMVGFNQDIELLDHLEDLDPATGKKRFTHTGCGGSWERIK